jgi:hypothetical protein
MYHRKTKRRTSYHDRYNAFPPSDCQVMQCIQTLLALSIHRQCQAKRILLIMMAMNCHSKRIYHPAFYTAILNYIQKL